MSSYLERDAKRRTGNIRRKESDMKIACLLGVSNYANCIDLPAGGRDLEIVNTLLQLTKEYEHICKIDGNQASSKVKQELVSFLKQFHGQEVEQVLFYFTGHGDAESNEFNYVLSDFDQGKKKQTVIENSELDNWLRPLNPALTIKVIDACHAGVQYIKDPRAFEASLAKTKDSFNSCYFLFSSQREQNSYQNAHLSDFTHSFIKSVASFEGTEMRFKDIIDFISDDFSKNQRQTPFFVTQASSTEVFSPVNQKMRNSLKTELEKNIQSDETESDETESPEPRAASLVELAKAEAKKYCTLEEVLSELASIQSYWRERTFTDDASSLYEFKCELLPSVSEVPRRASIGKWLAENEHNYFARHTTRKESFKVPDTDYLLGSALSPGLYTQKTKTETRNVVAGFQLTQEIEFPALRITAESKLENLSWHDCHITYVFSKTQIRFFYLFCTFRELNWGERKRNADGNWTMLTADFKGSDGVRPILDRISDSFTEYIMTPVRARFDLQDAPEKSDTDQQGESGASTPPKA